jgi:hypothetical protein
MEIDTDKNNQSDDMNMSQDLFNQAREASDTEFEKKGPQEDSLDDDNIIGGLGSVHERPSNPQD